MRVPGRRRGRHHDPVCGVGIGQEVCNIDVLPVLGAKHGTELVVANDNGAIANLKAGGRPPVGQDGEKRRAVVVNRAVCRGSRVLRACPASTGMWS